MVQSESHWPRRYRRIFSRRERVQLIDELAARTGFSMMVLRAGTLEQQQQLLDRMRHEVVIEEHEAGMLLDPNETPRVREFFTGEISARTLLDGVVPADAFLDCFLLWSGTDNRKLVRNGRSLRSVVETLRMLRVGSNPFMHAALLKDQRGRLT